jgi:hypothetical protein
MVNAVNRSDSPGRIACTALLPGGQSVNGAVTS